VFCVDALYKLTFTYLLTYCDVYSEISDDDGNSQSNGDKTDMKSESSDDGEEGDENASNCDDESVSRLFSLSFVNIYGNTEVSRLSDDGRQIKFGGRKHVPPVWLTLYVHISAVV